jgi:hypothetical protein
METSGQIHQRAIYLSKKFREAESALLEILQLIDDKKVFRELGYSSLFTYAINALKLSESQAYAFIAVSRKAKQIPELKIAIQQGELTVSEAKRITSVITPQNKNTWIEKAKNLTQRDLEIEVVKENPKLAVKEIIKPITENRLEMKLGISSKLEAKLKRVKDLLSRKTHLVISNEEALEQMVEFFLEKKDPLRKAERNVTSKKVEILNQPGKREHLPAKLKHQVIQRDEGRCTAKTPAGVRCSETRYVSLHHKQPIVQGGSHSLVNLETLCFYHHQANHLSGKRL